MFDRRCILALPLLLAAPGADAAPASCSAGLADVLVTCWAARGIRFTPEQVAARLGARVGKEALLAVAGATESADGDEVETAVEILWETGRPASPALPLLARDLAAGLPLLAIAGTCQPLLLTARTGDRLHLHDPLSGARLEMSLDRIALIGRPVIAGA
jgi:hypothetical protein